MTFGPDCPLDDPAAQADRRSRRGTGVRKARKPYQKMDDRPLTREQAIEVLRDLCDPKNLSSYLGRIK